MPHTEIGGTEKTGSGKKALFITGASGFLGSKILEELEPAEYSSITLLARNELALPERLGASNNICVIQASIHDVERYASQLKTNTIVLHLAAVTGNASPQSYYHVNVDGTSRLLEASVLGGVAGFLFASSIAVAFSSREGYHYAESKQQAEQCVRESGLKYMIVRPTIILGEGSPIWDSFSGLSRASLIFLPGTGKVRIQPVYIGDIVKLLLGVVSSNRFLGETLELGGPDILTIDDFVRRIHKAYHGDKGRVVHIPLGMLLGMLRVIERWFPALLPVSSGQFASFYNDGTAGDTDLCRSLGVTMKSVDDMLEQLTRQA